ncbi:hypothetical protein O1611_g8150 [Lasiodiplodia mahajangana]|uniref:Uncharacterized protein n=1 Tax=Lasiodiplodia mahajangana TaxID=1108764 RepID=A0ACC2JE48_9PEZI|nr:hypothetical protein O1611_g8150 [Lasiodiplodia mahajangana]
MNKVAKASCPLCQQNEATKTFTRLDHLRQHLKTFHKIHAGRIPDDLADYLACDSNAEEPTPHPPHPVASFPCPILGCVKTGEFAYLRQVDLDEHMLCMHNWLQDDTLTHRGLPNPSAAWVNSGFQQNHDWLSLPVLGQYVQQSQLLQPGSTGSLQADGVYLENGGFGGGNLNGEQNKDAHGFRNQL